VASAAPAPSAMPPHLSVGIGGVGDSRKGVAATGSSRRRLTASAVEAPRPPALLGSALGEVSPR
jgi:hypothetical protein